MDFTMVFEAALYLVGAVVLCLLVPYIKSKTTAEQQESINAWVRIAVKAAEQLLTGSGRGAEKKNYVLEWLDGKGITYDVAKIDAIIEAAVYELNKGLIK